MIVTDGHYYRAPDNNVYVERVYDYDFYKRYLLTFDEINVVARMEHIDFIPTDMKIANGKGISFWELPNFHGAKEYALKYKEIYKISKKYCEEADCAVFRIPSNTANLICKLFSKTNKPFSIEVVVDPWDYFSPGTLKNKIRPIVRVLWTRFTKKMCLKANGVSYVTEKYLQDRYPCKAINQGETSKYFTASYSSIDLKEESINNPRHLENKDFFLISHVSNNFSTYGKGHLPLLEAVNLVNERGYNVEVEFVGNGPLLEEFENYSKLIGIEEKVNFVGGLPNGEEVRKKIANSDIMVFPTRAEGLPRVLLEAMSEGLPCISTSVCGIPEIISNELLTEYDDYKGIADRIISLLTDPLLYNETSIQNINTVRKYTNTVLNKKRKKFYDQLYSLTIK